MATTTATIGENGYNLTGNESRIQLPGLGSKPSASELHLTAKERSLLINVQNEGIKRGTLLLASLTYDWEALAFSAVSSASSLVAGEVFANNDSAPKSRKERVSTTQDEIAADGISGLLGAAWKKVEGKIASDERIGRLAKVLNMGISAVLTWLKNMVLSKELLANLIPFYGAAKGLIDGAKGVLETRSHHTAWDSLKQASGHIASGFPMEALNAFERYANAEYVRSGLKTTYTFAKTLTSVLLQIFTAGASSVFDFATKVFEAVSSFAFNAFQALCFGKATDFCRKKMENDSMPSASEFQTICSDSPFAGCVFLGAANYIGHFNLTSVLSNANNVIAGPSMMASVAKVGEIQKLASKYIAASHFKMKFRSSDDKEQYGWVLKMMEGYASDAPKSEFITKNASFRTRLFHKARTLFKV